MRRSAKQISNRQAGGFSRRCLLLLLSVLLSGWLLPGKGSAQLSEYLQFHQVYPARDIIVVAGGGAAWKKLWDEARRLWRAGDYTEAEESYRQFLGVKDNIAEARWELAQILIGTEQWEKARHELDLLLEVPPARLEYLTALGLVLRHLGQFGRALEVFNKAHNQFPEDFTARVGLTQGLIEVGRKNEAFPLFQEIVSRKPDSRELHLALANLAFELRRLETARQVLVPLADAKHAELDTLLMAARVHEGLGREQEAAGYWERCLALAPGNREAQGRLALYYENRGRFEKALVHLLVLLEKNPQNTSLLNRICRIYVQTDRFAEARPYFERYVKLKPDKATEALPREGDLHSRQDEEQIDFFRRLLAISPNDLGVLNNLAAELEAAGNAAAALFLWENLARVAPERVEIYRAMAVLLEKMGRRERLMTVLETIHRLAPGDLE
jgi:tetratricopeptide (TPR) repeat protein